MLVLVCIEINEQIGTGILLIFAWEGDSVIRILLRNNKCKIVQIKHAGNRISES